MLAPRIGLAYRANEKTVVRAGFGITNDPYPAEPADSQSLSRR